MIVNPAPHFIGVGRELSHGGVDLGKSQRRTPIIGVGRELSHGGVDLGKPQRRTPIIGVGRELSHGGIDLGNPPMARRGSYLRSMICASFRGGTLYSEAPFGSLIGLIFEMRPKDSVGRHAHHCRSKTSRCARFTTTRGLMKKTLPRFPRLPTKSRQGLLRPTLDHCTLTVGLSTPVLTKTANNR